MPAATVGKWVDIHATVKKAEALPQVSWRAKKNLAGVSQAMRVQDAIDIHYQRYHKKQLQAGLQASDNGLFPCDLITDVTQCVKRSACSSSLRAMCSASSFYFYGADRMLLLEEHLGLLGWRYSRIVLKNLKESQVRDLSGESMAPPCIAVILHCLSLTLSDLWTEG
eukprot:1259393-Amphidinium_carterae.3